MGFDLSHSASRTRSGIVGDVELATQLCSISLAANWGTVGEDKTQRSLGTESLLLSVGEVVFTGRFMIESRGAGDVGFHRLLSCGNLSGSTEAGFGDKSFNGTGWFSKRLPLGVDTNGSSSVPAVIGNMLAKEFCAARSFDCGCENSDTVCDFRTAGEGAATSALTVEASSDLISLPVGISEVLFSKSKLSLGKYEVGR